jgi:hypothetical protein
MKHLQWTALLAGGMILGATAPAWSLQVTATGTVSKYVYRNPHVYLYIDIQGDNGETKNYAIEMSNLTNMIKRGIGKATFKPGDTVKVNFHPLSDGRPGGSYITIVAADGKTYE